MMAEEKSTCVNCNSELIPVLDNIFDTRFGSGDYYDIRRCVNCGLAQLYPQPGQDELKELYETYYNFSGTPKGLYVKIREKFLSNVSYRAWMVIDGDISFHSNKGSGRLLDVGCNEGRGLSIYKRNGFDAEGLELNENAAAEAVRRGFRVSTRSIAEFKYKNLYDVVVLSNVLEHSLDPKRFLLDVARLLKSGGQVWISCPNIDSWQRRLFGKYWINWHVPFHTIHFSMSTLGEILHESGFKIRSSRNESPALWFTQSLIASLFSRKGRQTRQLRSAIMVSFGVMLTRTCLFPILWLGNRMQRGDCLIVTAEKVVR